MSCVVCSSLRKACPGLNSCLGQYFVDQRESFHEVKTIFGITNAKKLIDKNPADQRDEAARFMKFEANARMNDPLGGSGKIVENLTEAFEDLKIVHTAAETLNKIAVQAEFARLNQEIAELREEVRSLSYRLEGDVKLEILGAVSLIRETGTSSGKDSEKQDQDETADESESEASE